MKVSLIERYSVFLVAIQEPVVPLLSKNITFFVVTLEFSIIIADSLQFLIIKFSKTTVEF